MSVVVCGSCASPNPEFNPTCSRCGAALGDESSPAIGGVPRGIERVGTTVDHYRIDAVLGTGGMGVVYRATDLELGRTVALKFLRIELAKDEASKTRFIREARAASALDHPNIGTIFEIGEHAGETFIAMAHYEGETLCERLKAPLSVAETIELLRELASALSAAHGAGIVHRDIKPANIFLTREGRVKLLDFGLAKGVDSGASADQLIGTPLYMAPEQMLRGNVDHRADLYALGVVAFEALARAHPMATDRPLSALRPDAPAHVVALIAKLIEKDPALRPESASAVMAMLAPPVAARRSRAWWWATAVVGALFFALWMTRNPRPPPSTGARRAVAVVGFRNLTDRPDSASTSDVLETILRAQLAQGDRVRVVPGETIARTKKDLGLTISDAYAGDTLARIRTITGADLVIGGAIVAASPEKLSVNIQVQDTESGEVIVSASESAPATKLVELAERLAVAVRRGLDIEAISRSEADLFEKLFPSEPRAMPLYSKGTALLARDDAVQAAKVLEEGVALAPDHAMSHAALARAYHGLGRRDDARAQIERALALAAKLPRNALLEIEALQGEIEGDYRRAIERYRALYTFTPDDVEIGLRLAQTETLGKELDSAFATLAALKKLPPPAGEDPRIWLYEAGAADMARDPDRVVATSSEAVSRAKLIGARSLEAQARRLFAKGIITSGGEAKAADAQLEVALALFEAVEDRRGIARILEMIGFKHAMHGELREAREAFGAALGHVTAIGDRRYRAIIQQSLANIIADTGDLDAAIALYKEAIGELEKGGPPHVLLNTRFSLALVYLQKGDREAAIAEAERGLVSAREKNDPYFSARLLGLIANASLAQGRIADAKTRVQDVMVIGRMHDNVDVLAGALTKLGRIAQVEGKWDEARARFEEASSLDEKLTDRANAALLRTDFASFLLECGDRERGLREADRALGVLGEESGRERGRALALRLRALAELGRSDEAHASVAELDRIVTKTSSLDIRVEVELTRAAVTLARRRRAELLEATAAIDRLRSDYQTLSVEEDLTLSLARAQLAAALDPTQRSRIVEVEKRARGAGFINIAELATRAMKGRSR